MSIANAAHHSMIGGGQALPYKKRLRYIESTGTQWINTGVIPQKTWDFYIELSDLKQLQGSFKTGALFGVAWSGNTVFNQCTMRYTQLEDYVGYWHGMASQTLLIPTNSPSLYQGHFGDGYRIDNGSRQDSSKNIKSAISNPLAIMTVPNAPSDAHKARMKLWKFAMYDTYNGTPQFEAIPVIDKQDVVCLYDNVGGTFLYNAGTGSFIAGPEI